MFPAALASDWNVAHGAAGQGEIINVGSSKVLAGSAWRLG